MTALIKIKVLIINFQRTLPDKLKVIEEAFSGDWLAMRFWHLHSSHGASKKFTVS